MATNPSGSHKTVNTHTYDGKLKDAVKLHANLLQETHVIDISIKKDVLEKLKHMIEKCDASGYIPGAVRALNLIISNCEQEPNYDSSNDLWAEDLLYLIDQKINDDIIPTLAEQLSDIVTSGKCPPGRTTRLWQVYQLLYDESRGSKADGETDDGSKADGDIKDGEKSRGNEVDVV